MRRFLLAIAILFFASSPILAEEAPRTTVLDVPFVVQAGTGVWSWPWQDFCEEATVVMAVSYATNAPLRPLAAALQMLRIAEFELYTFGYEKDTGLADTERVFREFYGFNAITITENPTIDLIKNEIQNGNLIIVPVAGRLLNNPYFVPPGPRYHMVLIRGYDEITKEFIVNEPGTKHGNGLRYREATLMNAMHDFVPVNQGSILSGPKRVLVVSKSLDSSDTIGTVGR